MRLIKLIMGTLLILLLVSGGIVAAQDDTPYIGFTYVGDGESGVIITGIVPESPAEEAGLAIGDVIVAIDDQLVTETNILGMVTSNAVGDSVDLLVLQDGETATISVTLAARPAEPVVMPGGAGAPGARIGILAGDTESNDGVRVVEVTPDSPAAGAGIQVDDVITLFDGEPITTARELIDAIGEYEPGDVVSVEVLRGDETLTFDVTLDEAPPANIIGRPMPGEDDLNFMQLAGLDVTFDAENGTWTVGEITEESDLYTAGLRSGDVITLIDGESVTNHEQMFDKVAAAMLSDGLPLTVERDGETVEIEAEMELLARLSFILQAAQRPEQAGD